MMTTLRRRLPDIVQYAVLSLAAFLSVFPFIWMVIGATNTTSQIVRGKVTFGTALFDNIASFFAQVDVPLVFWNSVKIVIPAVLISTALGAINGCLVNWTGLHPFIITLGTNAIFRGITLVISDANSVYGFSFDFVNFFAATPLGIPVPVIFSLIVAVILWFLTTRMRVGRNIYALGGNKNSAFYSGIDVKFHMLLVFIISGICAGLAGVVSTARLGAAEPLAGMGFETYAIASAIIGGTSFFGGKGRIFSVVIGGLIIGTINNGLNILQVQTYYQLVVMGGLIIAAVALDRLISK